MGSLKSFNELFFKKKKKIYYPLFPKKNHLLNFFFEFKKFFFKFHNREYYNGRTITITQPPPLHYSFFHNKNLRIKTKTQEKERKLAITTLKKAIPTAFDGLWTETKLKYDKAIATFCHFYKFLLFIMNKSLPNEDVINKLDDDVIKKKTA